MARGPRLLGPAAIIMPAASCCAPSSSTPSPVLPTHLPSFPPAHSHQVLSLVVGAHVSTEHDGDGAPLADDPAPEQAAGAPGATAADAAGAAGGGGGAAGGNGGSESGPPWLWLVPLSGLVTNVRELRVLQRLDLIQLLPELLQPAAYGRQGGAELPQVGVGGGGGRWEVAGGGSAPEPNIIGPNSQSIVAQPRKSPNSPGMVAQTRGWAGLAGRWGVDRHARCTPFVTPVRYVRAAPRRAHRHPCPGHPCSCRPCSCRSCPCSCTATAAVRLRPPHPRCGRRTPARSPTTATCTASTTRRSARPSWRRPRTSPRGPTCSRRRRRGWPPGWRRRRRRAEERLEEEEEERREAWGGGEAWEVRTATCRCTSRR